MIVRRTSAAGRRPGSDDSFVASSGAAAAPPMTEAEAVTWLRRVDGELYRTPPGRRRTEAWVAVVRAPRNGSQDPQTIIALGGTLEEAANAAARQWRELFRELGPLH